MDQEAAEELIQCARYGEVDELKGLLEANPGSDEFVNHQNEWGQSSLQCAAANGHGQICELLLKAGADPNKANKEGNTPLHWACLMGKTNCVKLILDSGKADVNFRNGLGRSALDEAHDRGHSEVFNLLVDAQAMPGQRAMEEAERMNEEAMDEDVTGDAIKIDEVADE